MRADRLIALLMLLQTRGRMTAAALAAELEVTERTIYRDLTALSASGIPVYSERGPGGGIGLVEEYRTTLTGLTPDEARALFMTSVPAPLAQLGVGQELKTALLKLSAALPESRRSEESRTRQRIHLDSTWWFQSDEAVPCLEAIRQAAWQDRRLRLTVRLDFFNATIEQEVEPYGLVAKASIWYLVHGRSGGIRVTRVSHIVRAEMLAGSFSRPDGFDLPAFWGKWCSEYEGRPAYQAVVRVAPDLLRTLPLSFGERIREAIAGTRPDPDGWTRMTLPFESFFAARSHLLGFGRAVEVLAPEALRKSLIDFAEQIVGFYKPG